MSTGENTTEKGFSLLKIKPSGYPLVRCSKHPTEYITNFCCLTYEPLCPECIDSHVKQVEAQGHKSEVKLLFIFTKDRYFEKSKRHVFN